MAARTDRNGDSTHAGWRKDSDGSSNWVTRKPATFNVDQIMMLPWQYSAYAAATAHTGATAAETAQASASLQGSLTIEAERFVAGSVIPFYAAVRFTSDNTGTETLTVKGYLGGISGTALFDSGALNLAAASVTNSPMFVQGFLKIRTAGASGAGVASGTINYRIGTGCQAQRWCRPNRS